MTSQLYPKGKNHILGTATQVDFASDNFNVLFYASTYSSAHEFVSDLTGGSIVARSGNLASVTITLGVIDANDITVTSVSGSAFSEVILYKNTGTDSTSPLIAIYDVSTFTPTGGDINVVFNASGLFGI